MVSGWLDLGANLPLVLRIVETDGTPHLRRSETAHKGRKPAFWRDPDRIIVEMN
jgi:hypothetical protein